MAKDFKIELSLSRLEYDSLLAVVQCRHEEIIYWVSLHEQPPVIKKELARANAALKQSTLALECLKRVKLV